MAIRVPFEPFETHEDWEEFAQVYNFNLADVKKSPLLLLRQRDVLRTRYHSTHYQYSTFMTRRLPFHICFIFSDASSISSSILFQTLTVIYSWLTPTMDSRRKGRKWLPIISLVSFVVWMATSGWIWFSVKCMLQLFSSGYSNVFLHSSKMIFFRFLHIIPNVGQTEWDWYRWMTLYERCASRHGITASSYFPGQRLCSIFPWLLPP